MTISIREHIFNEKPLPPEPPTSADSEMSSSEGEFEAEEEDLLEELLKRPRRGMTEVRRDGKDDAAVGRIIRQVEKSMNIRIFE